MPYKQKKQCSVVGCPELTYGRYCAKHQKEANAVYDRQMRNKSSYSFYHSREWIRKRKEFLLDHPLCEECRKHGILTPATVVDHIQPISIGGSYLDDDNLQTLCASCHSKKSIQEGSRFNNPRGGQNL